MALGSLARSADWPAALPLLLAELRPQLRKLRERLGLSEADEGSMVRTLAVVALLKAERIHDLRAFLRGAFRHLCLLQARCSGRSNRPESQAPWARALELCYFEIRRER